MIFLKSKTYVRGGEWGIMGVQKDLVSIKLEPDRLDNILEKYQGGSEHFFETVKFIYSLKEDNDFKKIVSINSETIGINFAKLTWVFVKYFKIAKELITIRRKIAHSLFDKYSSNFNRDRIEDLVKNTSNVWLEAQPQKIKVLKDYCMVLLSDPYFRKDICSEEILIEEYEKIQNTFRTEIDKEIRIYLEMDNKIEQDKKYSLERNKKTDGYMLMEMYQTNYEDDTFLDNKKGKVDE